MLDHFGFLSPPTRLRAAIALRQEVARVQRHEGTYLAELDELAAEIDPRPVTAERHHTVTDAEAKLEHDRALSRESTRSWRAKKPKPASRPGFAA